jgi:hypothetical protein
MGYGLIAAIGATYPHISLLSLSRTTYCGFVLLSTVPSAGHVNLLV